MRLVFAHRWRGRRPERFVPADGGRVVVESFAWFKSRSKRAGSELSALTSRLNVIASDVVARNASACPSD